MFSRILSRSKFLLVIACIGILVLAIALLAIGAYKVYHAMAELFTNGVPKESKAFLLNFIEIIDLFLLSTVFYVTSLGLYELFIDEEVPVPSWLHIKNIDDLKSKLISIVVVTLGVLFLGRVISWDGQSDLMGYGLGVGAVIFALAFFVSQKKKI
ncbi:MAG: YqhA family protein [Bacteroidota bacterium]